MTGGFFPISRFFPPGLQGPLALGLVLVLFSACSLPSHIHNPEAARLAAGLKEDFTRLEEGSASLGQLRAQALQDAATQRQELLHRYLMAHLHAQTALICSETRFPGDEGRGTWLTEIKTRWDAFSAKTAEDLNQIRKRAGLAEKTNADLKTTAHDLKAAGKRARQHQADLDKSRALLVVALKTFPDVMNRSGEADPLQDIPSILEKKIEVADGDGTTAEYALGDLLVDWLNDADRREATSSDSGDVEKWARQNPLLLLELALELNALEQERTSRVLARLKAYEQQVTRLEQYRILSEELIQTGIKTAGFSPGDLGQLPQDQLYFVRSRLTRSQHQEILKKIDSIPMGSEQPFKQKGEIDQEVQDLLQEFYQLQEKRTLMLEGLRGGLLAEYLLRKCEVDLRLVVLEQELSEMHGQSLIDDRIWRAHLGAGIETLDQFHQGGFKTEHLSTILNVAQTIALGVLAAGAL